MIEEIDWFWIRIFGVSFSLLIYTVSPLRTTLTEQLWSGFIRDFGNPGLLSNIFDVCPYIDGDRGNLFRNYHHFILSIKKNFTMRQWTNLSAKMKLAFIIESVGLLVTLYVSLITVFVCILLKDLITRFS